jgi:hypothetical protein
VSSISSTVYCHMGNLFSSTVPFSHTKECVTEWNENMSLEDSSHTMDYAEKTCVYI